MDGGIMRFYIHPTGSTCYDKTGLTYPVKQEIDIASTLLKDGSTYLANDVYWQATASNQPKRLYFTLHGNVAKKLDIINANLDDSILRPYVIIKEG